MSLHSATLNEGMGALDALAHEGTPGEFVERCRLLAQCLSCAVYKHVEYVLSECSISKNPVL